MAILRILPAPDSPRFPDLDAFVSYLRVERCASENTIANYSLDLRQFLTEMQARSGGAVSAVRDDIYAHLTFLQESGRSGNTVARHFQAVRSFYKFLRYSGRIRKDPSRGVRAPKFRLSLVESIPDADVQKLIAHLKEPKYETTLRRATRLRDRAIIQTFYDSGLRVGELIGLRLTDINLDDGAMRVLGKGDKQRIAPISPPQVVALKAYLEARPSLFGKHKEHGYLFIAGPRRGTQEIHSGHPISRQGVFYMVRDLGLAVLDRPIHPHQLRHSFGSTLVAHGADLRNVQALMGHSDIDTTMRYVHTDMSVIIAVHAKTHPRG